MPIQQGPADTVSYMLLGFGVILGIMALYLLSLWLRSRSAERDEAMLKEIQARKP
jgi:uncharacterized membrane protein YedE/YeeE